jgi:hypothetical protein
MEGEEGIYHGGHGDEGEDAGADLTHAVAKVEKTNGQAAEDDGEVEPAEEGSFVGEEDFWLDAGGESDAFAWGVWSVKSGFVWPSIPCEEVGND